MNVELHQKLIALGAPDRAPSLHAQDASGSSKAQHPQPDIEAGGN